MIAVLDTGTANISSVQFAIERLGQVPMLTSDPDVLARSARVVFPGVGTARALFERIQALELAECLKKYQNPLLGICLGMQALYSHSEEGSVDCLGLFDATVSKIRPTKGFRVPHMGWNQVYKNASFKDESLLLKNIEAGAHFYFVHSFAAPVGKECSGITRYVSEFSAVVEKGNFFGTQFHPEKSGKNGELLLRNFLAL